MKESDKLFYGENGKFSCIKPSRRMLDCADGHNGPVRLKIGI